MRRSLLNKLNTPKALRQALVLFTLLLLPTTAWGQTKITVAGVAMSESGNIENQNISGTVSYDADNKTLTLDNATITGSIIWNPATNTKLTIKIIGACTVNSSGNVCIENLGTSTALSIEKDNSSTEKASLYLSANDPNTYSIQGFSSLSYNGFNTYSSNEGNSPYSALTVTYTASGLTWESGQGSSPVVSVSFQESYDLWIGDTQVAGFNKDNVLGDEGKTVKFTPATGAAAAILYLNNATITGNIECNMDNALTIQLTGGNTVDGYISSSNNSVALTFTYPDGSNNSYLTVGGNAVSKAISGFNSVTLAEGLSYEENAFYNSNLGVLALQYYHDAGDVPIAHISYDYGLSVAGVEVRSTNKDNVYDGEKVKFTPADNTNPATLTLTDATINGGITWKTDANLTVEIIGSNNTITTSSGSCFNSTHSDKTISFTRGDTNNASKLVLNASTYHVISGFSNYEAPTVTGMFWIPTKDIFSNYIISATITSSLLGGGAGTESSPLVISTFDHLKDFATYVNIGTLTTEYVQLADNLDCSGKTGFEPIGNGSNPFKGTFDGNNKTISGLEFVTNDGPDFAGLFGKLDHESGLIKDLTLSGCTFKGGDCAGAIVAYLSKGTIQDCEVNSCIIETGNPQSPSCGGIVGTIQKGVVSNCTVNGGTITASTTYSSSPGNSFAGGIVGRYYLYAGNKISGCEVKGNVTITSSHAEATSSLSAGAIIGGTAYGDGPSLEDLDFSSNYYYSTVTTSTKKANDAAVEKSGQTQRGIGNGNDEIGKVVLAGTKTVTVKFISSNGNDSWDAVEGTYYKTSTIGTAQKDYYVLPGCNFTFSMKPKNGYKPRFALSDDAIEVTDVEKTENEAYDHTEFTFTMPSDNLEVIWSYPIDLAADNITATIDNANYTGEAIVPTTVKVKGAPGSANFTRELKKDEDFTIKGYKLNGESVDSPVEIGIYTVTIEGIGEYIGTQDVSYEIIKAYALKINGTQLNAKNIDDFYGNGTVKFTPATETEPTNTLTLNGASVTGTIESGLGNLTIKLIGSNTIQGNGSSLITSLNGGTLTFDSDGTTISLLEFKDASGNVFPNDPISGFAEVKYGWVEYVESEVSKKVCSWDIEILKNGTSYRIYDGNKDHILGEGDESVKYSHDATNGHVITLNNAEVNCIWTDIHADITIALNGTNRVIDTGGTYAIYSNNGKINFVKAEGATSVELTATCGNGYVPIAYGSITLGEGLYWKPFYADANATVKSTVITDDPEFIIIEDYVMTDDRSIETAITYDSTKKILTFNQYAGALTSQIKTGVQGLTIKLKGTSTVAASSLDYPFKAMTNTASILFDGENDSETGSLVMETNSDSAPFEGFAEGAITYNKVVYSRDDGGNNIHTIKAPTAPTMSLDNEKVKLTKDYDDGTIYYSIAYADDTPSETGVKYSEPFAITHPGVVTAWVEANNATTSTVTGKHFAYQNAPYTMAINGIKTPTLLPTIAEGDVISLQRYASEDEDIASFIDGLITAKKPGTVTLSAILMPGDNTPFKVLNPVSDPNAPNEHTVSFSVYVGENLSNYFEGSNEFGTFYNEDSEIYAVPQGMKAYVVTGVSGSKLVTVETTVLPPNTVVLLDKAEGISFTKVPSEGAAPGGNLLKHATADISVTTESSLYVLYNDMYVKATAGSPIPSGKNYLDLSPTTNAGTRGFYNIIGEDDGSTGISEVKSEGVNSEKWNGEWFDLQGRRLPAQPTKPGLYIHKDKKVVIK